MQFLLEYTEYVFFLYVFLVNLADSFGELVGHHSFKTHMGFSMGFVALGWGAEGTSLAASFRK